MKRARETVSRFEVTARPQLLARLPRPLVIAFVCRHLGPFFDAAEPLENKAPSARDLKRCFISTNVNSVPFFFFCRTERQNYETRARDSYRSVLIRQDSVDPTSRFQFLLQ